MLFPLLRTPFDRQRDLAKRAKESRLRADMTQAELAEKSGVSLSSIKRFEGTGDISFASLMKLAYFLGEAEAFDSLFPPRPLSLYKKPKPPRKRCRHRKATEEEEEPA